MWKLQKWQVDKIKSLLESRLNVGKDQVCSKLCIQKYVGIMLMEALHVCVASYSFNLNIECTLYLFPF